MDYVWYSYCLLGLCVLWWADYIKKVITWWWYDKDVFLLLCFMLYIILFGSNMIIFWDNNINLESFLIAVPAGFFDFMIPVGMLAALKYADSSLVLVTIRMITSFALLVIGAWFFWDKLHVMNIIWFLLGVFAIYLLSGYEYRKQHKISKKWIIWMSLCIIWVILSYSYFKYFVDNVDIENFMFFKFLTTWILVCIYFSLRWKWKNFTVIKIKQVLWYALLTAVLVLSQFNYILPKMFSLWPLSISYKILSYSLAIPILLSILFHWEQLTKKRIIAFSLTAISLLFFFF